MDELRELLLKHRPIKVDFAQGEEYGFHVVFDNGSTLDIGWFCGEGWARINDEEVDEEELAAYENSDY